MNLMKDEVVRRFCRLASHVNEEQYGWEEPGDCFCADNPDRPAGYRFDARVIEFIERAVERALPGPGDEYVERVLQDWIARRPTGGGS
jgi:hypothetical protein